MTTALPLCAIVFLGASPFPGPAQDRQEERTRRILERLEKVLEGAHQRLLEEVERIVREEIRKARASGAPRDPAPVPRTDPPPAKRAYLGISPGELTDEERKALGIGGGIRIAEVRGPAEKTGLRPGDVLLEIGREPVTEETIVGILGRHRPGETVEVVVLRDRRRVSLKVVLGERED